MAQEALNLMRRELKVPVRGPRALGVDLANLMRRELKETPDELVFYSDTDQESHEERIES